MQYSRLLKIALICIPDEPIIFTLLCNFPCPPSCACAFTLGATAQEQLLQLFNPRRDTSMCELKN